MVDPNLPAWTYYNPVRLFVGKGAVEKLTDLIPASGTILLVTTEGATRRGLTALIQKKVGADRLTIYDKVTTNPELDDLDHATQMLLDNEFGAILAVGGGSVLDAAKVLSVTIPAHAEGVLARSLRAGGQQSWQKRIPVIAVPTTSGTGAEVTPFATVWDRSSYKKYSVVGELVFPVAALLDPELTLQLPPDQTLLTALDAVSHSLESLWNKNRSSISEAFAFESLKLAAKAIPELLKHPDNIVERSNMQQASMLAGLAISRTRTAIAHSISYPLTSHFGVPHGLACSFTLPAILRAHYSDLSKNKGELEVLRDVLSVLEDLELEKMIQAYATPEQIRSLKGEMFTKDRADNFIFKVSDVEDFLPR